PAERGPSVRRRLSVPGLRDRVEVGVSIVIECDDPSHGVCYILNIAAPIVVDSNNVAIAIFYGRAAIFIDTGPGEREARAVRRTQDQIAAVSQLQIRRVSR